MYRFISYNMLYSYLSDSSRTPAEEFASDKDAVGKSVSDIQKIEYGADSYKAATLVPCYLGHSKMIELLEDMLPEIKQIIQAIWTKEHPERFFTIIPKDKGSSKKHKGSSKKHKGSSNFWEGRAANDSEHVELIENYLDERLTLSDSLKNKLTKTNGKVTDALFCESILMLTYQVRCNLFHGSKKSTDKQEMILAPMHQILNRLIDETVRKIDESH
jgi:hypothetical protein